jgi:hypothetical protein
MIRCYQIKQHQSSALDLQTSATTYVAREVAHPSLDDLATVAELIEIGRPIPSELEGALLRGTSIGGTRPKALIKDGDRALIAKFSSTTDTYPVMQGEFLAMSLATRAGLDDAAKTLQELFGRIAFNTLCGNNDDHGRNHSAFITNEGMVALTPGDDLRPQARSGSLAYTLAMPYDQEGNREARLALLIEAAHLYLLGRSAADDVIDGLIETIRAWWNEVFDLAQLTEGERDGFRGRQFLNPVVLD